MVFEAEYADTVPRADYEVSQKKLNVILKKNQSLREICDQLKAQVKQKKEELAALESEESSEEEEEDDEEEEEEEDLYHLTGNHSVT